MTEEHSAFSPSLHCAQLGLEVQVHQAIPTRHGQRQGVTDYISTVMVIIVIAQQ